MDRKRSRLKPRALNECFQPRHRVRLGRDYLRCYRRGQRVHGVLCNLYFHANGSEEARMGITASRKVGNSVVRHRLKRYAREIFRRSSRRRDLGGLDVVVHLKPAAAQAEFAAMRQELSRLLSILLRKAGTS